MTDAERLILAALAALAEQLDLPLVREGRTFYRPRLRGLVDLSLAELDAVLTLVNAAPRWLREAAQP